jgi:hypothetical protein
MISIAVFGTVLALIVAFLALKTFEASRNILVLPGVRGRADSAVVKARIRVRTSVLRFMAHFSARKILHNTLHGIATGTAYTAKSVETHAHKIAERVSRSDAYTNGSSPTKSNFLQEITNHKNNLDTDSVKRDTKL